MNLNATLLALLQQAVARHQAGDLARAETLFNQALRIDPRQPDALHYLGVLAYQNGDPKTALKLVERSLRQKPKYPAALNSHGIILGALGRRAEALASFDRAIALNANDPIALTNRGNVLHELGRFGEALGCYELAIIAAPGYAEAVINKANTLVALGRPEQALASFERALSLNPRHEETHFRLALTLERLGRYTDAIASYDRALALRPDRVAAWNNRGVAFDRLFNYSAARESYERALQIQPDYAEALINLASRYHNEGRQSDAIALLDRRLAADPTDPRARLLRVMYSLPIIYRDEQEVTDARAEYQTRLQALHNELDDTEKLGRFATVIGAAQPYQLPYQGYNDRELQRSYGELACRIAAAHVATPELPRPATGERIRIAIVSSLFRKHTVWHLMLKAWVSQFDRTRFEVFGYHTIAVRDACTDAAAAACDHFVYGSRSLAEWRRAILADAPHVILYPEIGMDTIAAQLAAQRLARVQCNSWGHPETSGFPTLDYFLSSDAMEPPDAAAAYTEQLIKLPNLGIYYEPETPAATVSRAELGLRPDATVFWCCQSLFKYLPRHDEVFPRIARELPNAQFAFIAYPHGSAVTEIFRHRLAAAFAKFGLDYDGFCITLPRFDATRFAAAFSVCDVVLDSIGWSGGQTTLESLPHNRPTVTMAGPLMRGRHTAAMLNLMDIGETVAATPDEYVTIAARLGRDPAWRSEISNRIATWQHRLYRDRSVITALENFLDRAARAGA